MRLNFVPSFDFRQSLGLRLRRGLFGSGLFFLFSFPLELESLGFLFGIVFASARTAPVSWSSSGFGAG